MRPIDLLPHGIQHAVDELHRLLGAERARQLERFVDDDGRRRRRRRAAARRPPCAGSAGRGPPSARAASARRSRRSADRSRRAARPCRAPARWRTSRRSSAGGSASGHCRSKNVAADLLDVARADVPLIQDLQRRLAGAVARVLPRARHRLRSSASPAASAARQPPPSRSPPPPLRAPCSTALARARQRLLDRVGRQHAERHRHAGRRRRRRSGRAPPPTRCTRSAASRRESGSRGRRSRRTGRVSAACCAASGISKAPGTRTTRDVARRDAGRGERRQRAGLQAIGDEVVVPRHDDREPESRRAS